MTLFKNDWDESLKIELESTYFEQIGAFLSSEVNKGKTIYPARENIFKALRLCSREDTKVVIVGQDPYADGSADGLAFSCDEETVRTPPSLQQIFYAIEQDIYGGFLIQEERCLERWASQGVLLLNRYLTVEKNKPLSHSLIGWENLTNEIICSLSGKEDAVVFLLWGKEAQKVKKLITNSRHLIIECEHPAAASYGNRAWEHNKCFSKTNKFLIENGKRRIEW